MKFKNPKFKGNRAKVADRNKIQTFVEAISDDIEHFSFDVLKVEYAKVFKKPESEVTQGEVHQVMLDLGYEMDLD